MTNLSPLFRVFLIVCLMVVAFTCVQGCANTHVYAQGFIGLRTSEHHGFESCSKENAGVRVGIERKVSKHVSVAGEYEHVSHLLCGNPFNDKPEAAADHVGVVVTGRWDL